MSPLLAFPVVLFCSVVQVALRNPGWAAFSGFVAGWYWPDFLQALLHLGATP